MDIAEIIKQCGGVARLARLVNRHHSTVLGWKCVPARHVRVVARALNVPAEDILPPCAEAPAPHREEIAA